MILSTLLHFFGIHRIISFFTMGFLPQNLRDIWESIKNSTPKAYRLLYPGFILLLIMDFSELWNVIFMVTLIETAHLIVKPVVNYVFDNWIKIESAN